MAVSQAQKIAKAKYQQEKRTLIAAEVSKDKGEFYRVSAVGLGISLSKLVQNGVEEYISRHAGKDCLESLPTPTEKSLSPADERLLDEFAKLSPGSQKALMQFLRTINQQVS